MKTIVLQNQTNQVQHVVVREPLTRRLHSISVLAKGSCDLDIVQVTHDVIHRVNKGFFNAFDETGRKIEFFTKEVVEKAQELAEEVKDEVEKVVDEVKDKIEDVVHDAEEKKEEAPAEPTPDSAEGTPAEKTEAHVEEHKCEVCGETFGSARGLAAHKRVHEDKAQA